MKIKLLEKKDIPACLEIVLKTGASSNKDEAQKIMELSLTPGITPLNPAYYVLEQNKKIIGISGLYYDYEDPKDIMWMDYFAVDPEFQRQGFGTKMLENLEEVCKEEKVRMLCVFTDKESAVNFYQNKGFKICGEIKNYYSDGKNRIWLNKIL